MEFIKKNYLIIIFAVLMIVIIGLTVKVINCNPVSIAPPNREREYLLHKIEQDSLEIEALNFNHFKALAEAKHSKMIADSLQRQLTKLKQKTNDKQKDVANLSIGAGDSMFNDWTSKPAIQW